MHVRDLNLKTDTEGFEQWLSVWRATDHEKFPDEEGWDGQDVRAMVASHDERDTKLLLALTDDREPAGAAMLQLPLRDNRHAV